jgi:glycosyltransferase involved in cell wall biosynthesis
MHICQITSMHRWNDDRIYERACRCLVDLGHQVTLIAIAEKDCIVNGVEVIALKPRTGWKRRWHSSKEALEIAKKVEADVYHFHDPDLLPWMNKLSADGKVVVYDVHENYVARFQMWGIWRPVSYLLEKFYRCYENYCVRKYSGIVVVSESVGELFYDNFKKSVVVQNVPYIERFSDLDVTKDSEKPVIIYTSGTHSDARNCIPTVESAALLDKNSGDFEFQFVGRYEPENYKELMYEKVCELKLDSQVLLLGMLPWEDNFKRTATAGIGCVFYADNPNNRVTIPNRLFEYMFCGVAVIAHDFPELKRVVEEENCGVLVDSSSPESIANGLRKILMEPTEMVAMGKRGRDAVSRYYNFKTQCLAMVEFYNEIIAVGKS